MDVNISFLGGTGTVTGSKYLVRHGKSCLLIDCGLFQGYKLRRLRNWTPLPIPPSEIKAVILTHAHLDHSGYLPVLAKEGFKGHIYATKGSLDLCRILLPDSGHLQEEDASFANRHGFSKHSPALPLYTREEAIDCLPLIKAVEFNHSFSPIPGWKATFSSAGHILGAASLLLEVAGRRLLFSGDLGRPDDLIMNPPDKAPDADTVLIESTYGDRAHPKEDVVAELGPALQKLVKRGGIAVVPVFAVGRAQALLHAINLLKAKGEIPHSLPVYLDSPMAVNTTNLFVHHLGEHRLSQQEAYALTHAATMVSSLDESIALAGKKGPMVILSASGMATGGRVLHHIAHHAGDPKNMIILTGFQAPGTRGATLASGAKLVRIHGRDVLVHAEIIQLQSASAHADGDQIMAWLATMPKAPSRVYVVHGELGASDELRKRLQNEKGWPAMVPEHGSTWPA